MSKNQQRLLLSLIFIVIAAINFLFFDGKNSDDKSIKTQQTSTKTQPSSITQNGSYTSKNDVASYIFTYKKLPQNFITKKQAIQLGWEASKGNLWSVAPGKSIGGDRFGNFEKKLPTAKGRHYIEADIEYKGGKRGAKRIVFSNDGLVFYTADHYENFEKLEQK
ncbi:ribonuclease domain-containing protein [Campylobacter suis]|uniref:Ribonuclease n=1 Tax=Campylobacter suis TaxID=2790657 RepID=A0ABN7K1C0_9BACT|nr:ribonuclease domain-containing protein [Campylobacter suis]CAD7286321.1 Ribonuclease [Campylobacter suis]